MAFAMAERYDGELCRRSLMAQRDSAIWLAFSRWCSKPWENLWYYSSVIFTIFLLCVCSVSFQKTVLHEKQKVHVPLKIDDWRWWSTNNQSPHKMFSSLASLQSKYDLAQRQWVKCNGEYAYTEAKVWRCAYVISYSSICNINGQTTKLSAMIHSILRTQRLVLWHAMHSLWLTNLVIYLVIAFTALKYMLLKCIFGW